MQLISTTGIVDSAVVTDALERGHQVIAAVRRPHTIAEKNGNRSMRTVDIRDPDRVAFVLAEADAAVLAIRVATGEEDQLVPLTHRFLDTAAPVETKFSSSEVQRRYAPLITRQTGDR